MKTENKIKEDREVRCTAFQGPRRLASGDVRQVALDVKEIAEKDPYVPVLIFDDITGELVQIDFRGTADDVLKQLEQTMSKRNSVGGSAAPDREAPQGPGRPRLGVVAREVTLLPRHWEWLNQQPGGASVALRKLVEEARRANSGKDRIRQSQNASYRFMSAMAGDQPGYEEAIRALFAGKKEHFEEQVGPWPQDIRDHAEKLAADAFMGASTDGS